METGAPGFRSGVAFAQQQQRRAAVESDKDIGQTILIHIGDAADTGVLSDGIEVFPEVKDEGRVAVTRARHGAYHRTFGPNVGLAEIVRQAITVQIPQSRRFADLVIVKLHVFGSRVDRINHVLRHGHGRQLRESKMEARGNPRGFIGGGR